MGRKRARAKAKESDDAKALAKYTEDYDRAFSKYRDFYTETYDKRMDTWERMRDDTREEILQATESLEVGKDHRVRSDTRASRKKIRTFQKRTDRAMGKLIVRGERMFGMAGSRQNKPKGGGFQVGDLNTPFKGQVRNALDKMFNDIQGSLQRNNNPKINGLTNDFDSFIDDAETLLGKHGRDLAENIGENLRNSLRPNRNQIEQSPWQRKTKGKVQDDTNLDLKPVHKRNVEFSMKAHIRAIARAAGDGFAKKMKARKFIKVDPQGDAQELGFKNYIDKQYNTLGPGPADESIAVPVPRNMEKSIPSAVEIVKENSAKRRKFKRDLFK